MAWAIDDFMQQTGWNSLESETVDHYWGRDVSPVPAV